MTPPSQKAAKLPAVRPDRMLSDAPPSSDEETTSRTWAELVEVNTLTSSGMMAPARVPQVMMLASFHQIGPSSPSIHQVTRKVRPTEMRDVTHTSCVRGASKSSLSASA